MSVKNETRYVTIWKNLYILHTYMCVDLMGSKNISISDEAYLRLSELKSRNESFTDVINRLTKKTNILDLKGIIK